MAKLQQIFDIRKFLCKNINRKREMHPIVGTSLSKHVLILAFFKKL